MRLIRRPALKVISQYRKQDLRCWAEKASRWIYALELRKSSTRSQNILIIHLWRILSCFTLLFKCVSPSWKTS